MAAKVALFGRSQSLSMWAPHPSLEPRRGPSGAPIVRSDPRQLLAIPRAFEPAATPAPRRLAILFPHGIAENLMLGAALRALEQRLPETEIALFVRPDIVAADLWPSHGPAGAIFALDAGLPIAAALADARERGDADRAIVLAGARPRGTLASFAQHPQRQRVFAAELGVEPDSFRYELPIGAEHRAAVAALFGPGSPPTVALNRFSEATASWSPREYRRMASLLRARGFRVLHGEAGTALTLAPGERAPGDLGFDDLPEASFLTHAAALERCVAVVSVDSTTMHIAAALGKPTAGIFSRATPMLGHTYEATHALLFGQPDADRVLTALERLPGGIGRASVPLAASTGAPGGTSPGDIDFVIAAFNEERNLPRLLASLRANDVVPDAVTVVDKGSIDRTSAIAHDFGARVLLGGRNSSEQRNIGANATARPFLAFLDADMELVPGQVEEWKRLLRDASCLTIPEISMGVDRLGRARSLERGFIGANPEIESARIFAREVFERAGGYRVDLYGCEDWALSDAVVGSYPAVRGERALLHHEGPLSTPQLFAKYRRYGRGYFALLLENRRRFVRHTRPLRGEMLSGIVAAGRRKPGLLLAWLQFRTVTYAAGLVGFLEAALDRMRRSDG